MINRYFISNLLILLCASAASAQTVTLDYYFNHEVHKTASGKMEHFHYIWKDKGSTGFSIWGNILKKDGARLDTLDKAPTLKNLEESDIYIIVDPDNKKESPAPNFIERKDIEQIAAWVEQGGVMVLMANDSANVELNHFNDLAHQFGLHFNNDIQNHVINDDHFEDGMIAPGDNPVFKTAKKLFLKDVCGISYKGKNVIPILKAKTGTAIAVVTKYGKGSVFAVGDPWLYNEYVNGRLPADFDNDKAANDLTIWLLHQARSKK